MYVQPSGSKQNMGVIKGICYGSFKNHIPSTPGWLYILGLQEVGNIIASYNCQLSIAYQVWDHNLRYFWGPDTCDVDPRSHTKGPVFCNAFRVYWSSKKLGRGHIMGSLYEGSDDFGSILGAHVLKTPTHQVYTACRPSGAPFRRMTRFELLSSTAKLRSAASHPTAGSRTGCQKLQKPLLQTSGRCLMPFLVRSPMGFKYVEVSFHEEDSDGGGWRAAAAAAAAALVVVVVVVL